MDVDLGHGTSDGDTLTWTDKDKPATGVRTVCGLRRFAARQR
jgi:hypothetical protein